MVRKTGELRIDMARHWAIRFCASVDPATVQRFKAWVDEDPSNARRFLLAGAEVMQAREEHRALPDDEAATAAQRPAAACGSHERTKYFAACLARAREPAVRQIGGMLGFALVIVVLAVLFMRQPPDMPDTPGWEAFAATTAIQRVPLDDGSIMTLNAGSQFRVRYTTASREVQLDSGGALFAVQKAANRPFTVTFRGGFVESVGTVFTVSDEDGMTRVAVLEGRVRIHAMAGASVIDLDAGGTAHVSPTGVVQLAERTTASPVEPELPSRTLGDIAAEYNANHPALPLVVDEGARNAKILLKVNATDPEVLIVALESLRVFEVDRRKDAIYVRLKRRDEGR